MSPFTLQWLLLTLDLTFCFFSSSRSNCISCSACARAHFTKEQTRRMKLRATWSASMKSDSHWKSSAGVRLHAMMTLELINWKWHLIEHFVEPLKLKDIPALWHLDGEDAIMNVLNFFTPLCVRWSRRVSNVVLKKKKSKTLRRTMISWADMIFTRVTQTSLWSRGKRENDLQQRC